MPEYTSTGKRRGSTTSSGRTPVAVACARPIRTSNSYRRDILQVSKDGQTVFGIGKSFHSRDGSFHCLQPFSVGFPRGMFMLAWDIKIQVVVSVLSRSRART